MDDIAIVMRLHEFAPVGGRPAGGCEGRRLERFAEMREDRTDGCRVGDEGDEPDVAAACGALEREMLADAGEEFRLLRRDVSWELGSLCAASSPRPSPGGRGGEETRLASEWQAEALPIASAVTALRSG